MAWYDDLPKNANIESYWKCEELSGIRYDASLRGNDLDIRDVHLPVGYSTDGISGNCAVFTGALYKPDPLTWLYEQLYRPYAQCSGLKGGTGFTLKFWFNPTDPQSGLGALIYKFGVDAILGSRYSYLITWNDSDNKVGFQVSVDGLAFGAHQSSMQSQELTTGQWHDIWCIFDGDNQEMHIYADEVKNSETGTVASAHNDTFYDFRIGYRYIGKMDSVVFWNVALTEENILGEVRPLWMGPYNAMQII